MPAEASVAFNLSVVAKTQQLAIVSMYIYQILTGAVKLSFLLFFRRLFGPNKRTLAFIWIGIVFVCVAYLALFFAHIFQCTPVEKVWSLRLPGWCFPPKILAYFSGSLNIFTDLYIFVLPIPSVLALKMKLKKKLRTLAVFAVGIL